MSFLSRGGRVEGQAPAPQPQQPAGRRWDTPQEKNIKALDRRGLFSGKAQKKALERYYFDQAQSVMRGDDLRATQDEMADRVAGASAGAAAQQAALNQQLGGQLLASGGQNVGAFEGAQRAGVGSLRDRVTQAYAAEASAETEGAIQQQRAALANAQMAAAAKSSRRARDAQMLMTMMASMMSSAGGFGQGNQPSSGQAPMPTAPTEGGA